MAIMKLLAQSFLFIIFTCGCSTEKERQEAAYEFAATELNKHLEKIVFLSSIEKMPYDTLFLILRDYNAATEEYRSDQDSLQVICKKTISTISKNYHLPESKIASLLFSFKYEMQTKDEIINEEKKDDINYND